MVKRLRNTGRGSDFRGEELGATLVEFAICILLMLTMLFMTFELASAVYTYTVMADAANEGLRYLIVHSSDSGGAATTVRTYAAMSLHDVSGTNLTVAVTPLDGTFTPPNRVKITVTYPFLPYTSFMTSPPTMSAFAEGRLVY